MFGLGYPRSASPTRAHGAPTIFNEVGCLTNHRYNAKQQEKEQPRRPPKIQIVEYHADLFRPDDRIIAYTASGERLLLGTADIAPQYSTYRRLYVDEHEHFFSLTRKGLRNIYDGFSPAHRVARKITRNGISGSGSNSPFMPNFGGIACYIFVCTVFHGPRPIYPDGKRAECDHLNGDRRCYAADNLEWVHPKENAWRSRHVLQVLRKHDINPADYSGPEMRVWFRVMRELDEQIPDHRQRMEKQDYLNAFTAALKQ